MATARDIVTGALRLLGVVSQGETPQAEEASEGLEALNQMIEGWSNDNLFLPSITEETFSLVVGQASYTMGSGGDFDTVAPLGIENAYIVSTPNPANDVKLDILTSREYSEIAIKSTQSTIPRGLYVEYTYPLARLTLYPVPSEAKTLKLFTMKPVSNFANLSTTINLPVGYNRALRFNLAQELAPEYGKEASPTVQTVASRSLATIKRKHTNPVYLKCDSGVLGENGIFDYRTGE